MELNLTRTLLMRVYRSKAKLISPDLGFELAISGAFSATSLVVRT